MENLVKNKLHICKEWHIQPSEIDRLQYFEYEQMVDEIKAYNKEQEKQQKAQNKEYEQMRKNMSTSNQTIPNLNKMQNQALQNLPKVSIPRFN